MEFAPRADGSLGVLGYVVGDAKVLAGLPEGGGALLVDSAKLIAGEGQVDLCQVPAGGDYARGHVGRDRKHEADGFGHLRADSLLLCEAALRVVVGVLARVPDGALVPVGLIVEYLDIAQLVEDPLLDVFVLCCVPGGVDELVMLGDVLVET